MKQRSYYTVSLLLTACASTIFGVTVTVKNEANTNIGIAFFRQGNNCLTNVNPEAAVIEAGQEVNIQVKSTCDCPIIKAQAFVGGVSYVWEGKISEDATFKVKPHVSNGFIVEKYEPSMDKPVVAAPESSAPNEQDNVMGGRGSRRPMPSRQRGS